MISSKQHIPKSRQPSQLPLYSDFQRINTNTPQYRNRLQETFFFFFFKLSANLMLWRKVIHRPGAAAARICHWCRWCSVAGEKKTAPNHILLFKSYLSATKCRHVSSSPVVYHISKGWGIAVCNASCHYISHRTDYHWFWWNWIIFYGQKCFLVFSPVPQLSVIYRVSWKQPVITANVIKHKFMILAGFVRQDNLQQFAKS